MFKIGLFTKAYSIQTFFYYKNHGIFKSKPFFFKRKTHETINFFFKVHFLKLVFLQKNYFQNKLLLLKTFIIKIKIMEFLNPNPFSLKGKPMKLFKNQSFPKILFQTIDTNQANMILSLFLALMFLSIVFFAW